jgi:hypothetical protein
MTEDTMDGKEIERQFLGRLTEYVVSLPFDLKVLQEAVSDPDLSRSSRELAAGTIIHTLLPQEGDSPQRYVDDVFLVRAALARIGSDGEGGEEFRARFAAEVFDRLGSDLDLFRAVLGELWPWLEGKLVSMPRQVLKGKRVAQCLDDDEANAFLYEQGLEFQTNYPANEEQVRNKLRRVDTLLELLQRRRTDEARKIG